MIRAKDIISEFKLKIINSDYSSIEKEVSGTLHRFGLELAGNFKNSWETRNVIGWGAKENNYLLTLNKKKRKEALYRVINDGIPLILLSRSIQQEIQEEVILIANEFKVPVCKMTTKYSTYKMKIDFYIIQELSIRESVHGSLVVINGIGVMIIGKSGIGKSEALLELVEKGNSFVSDDTVILKKFGQQVIGYPAEITKGFLESRGLGLIDIPLIYGLQSVKQYSNIDLVIELLPASFLNLTDRVGNKELYYNALEINISKIQIPVENGRNISSLIVAATNVFMAKQSGHNPIEIIKKRGW